MSNPENTPPGAPDEIEEDLPASRENRVPRPRISDSHQENRLPPSREKTPEEPPTNDESDFSDFAEGEHNPEEYGDVPEPSVSEAAPADPPRKPDESARVRKKRFQPADETAKAEVFEGEDEEQSSKPVPPPTITSESNSNAEDIHLAGELDRKINKGLVALEKLLNAPDRPAFAELDYVESMKQLWSERQIAEDDPVWLLVQVASMQDERYRESFATLGDLIHSQAEILVVALRYLRVQANRLEKIGIDAAAHLDASEEVSDLLRAFGQNGAAAFETFEAVAGTTERTLERYENASENVNKAAGTIAGISLHSIYAYGFGLAAAVGIGFLTGRFFV